MMFVDTWGFKAAILMRNHKITDIVTEDEHFGEIGMGFNVLFADN